MSEVDRPEALDDLIARMPWLAPGRAASPEEVAAADARRERAERERRIAPYAQFVRPDDVRRIVEQRVDSPISNVVRRFVAAYDAKGEANFLWLSGMSGCGKTVACLSQVAERGGVFAIMADLVSAMRPDAYHSRELAELRRTVLRARVLVVDEVGVGAGPDVENPVLFELVNARQGIDGLTFFTSNAGKADFEKYDARMRGRLHQAGFSVFAGYPSLRGNLSAKR